MVYVSPVCRSVLTIPSGKISNRYNESSLLDPHIAVNLTLK